MTAHGRVADARAGDEARLPGRVYLPLGATVQSGAIADTIKLCCFAVPENARLY